MKGTVKYWQWTEMSSEPPWNCPRTESCERSTATGSMPSDLRRQMHVRRTLSSYAELRDRLEQTTEFDLQHRNLRRANKLTNAHEKVTPLAAVMNERRCWRRLSVVVGVQRRKRLPMCCRRMVVSESVSFVRSWTPS